MSKNQKTETAITVAPNEKVNNFLTSINQNLNKYAIRNYEQRHFMNSVVIAIESDSKLQECLNTREGQISMYNALKIASSTGLSLNPQENKAVLIARSGKVTYQVMKEGMIELALERGIKKVRADLVRENDELKIENSINGDFFSHNIALKDRGSVIGFYAALITDEGDGHVKYMTTDEIKEHAERYSSYIDKKTGARKYNPMVKSHPVGYGLKTVLKRLLKSVFTEEKDEKILHIDEDTTDNAFPLEQSSFDREKGHSGETVKNDLEEKARQEEVKLQKPEEEEETDQNPETSNGFIY